MSKTYQGKFKCNNPEKYIGDYSNIYYRSSWELAVMIWADKNLNIKKWSSEETIISYLSPIDKKYHRYFVDFKFTFKDDITLIVEIKPEKETLVPENKKNKRKATLIKEATTYVINQAKWKAANKYANDRGWKFTIWTENSLRNLGIPIFTNGSRK